MATVRQRGSGPTENSEKTQKDWDDRSRSEQARAESGSKARGKPTSTGEGNYYHVEVRPQDGFETFRTQDVGEKGHIQRVAGKRASGSWATVKWLISKEDAHVMGGRLVGDTKEAKETCWRSSARCPSSRAATASWP